MPTDTLNIIVLGAGVAGLTTAHSLLAKFPSHLSVKLNLTIIAKHLPGDINQTEYCSPQAGANWRSFEKELNQYGQYDKVAFERFLQIARESPESGVKRFPLRLVYGDEDDKRREEFWFEELVGGIVDVPKDKLPEGASWGVDLETFIFNPVIYCNWLFASLIKRGVKIIRRSYDHVDSVVSDFPNTTAIFNCTGLGSRYLGGVKDKKVHPTKGHTILISEPKKPLERMYVWTQPSIFPPGEFSHVFPRPLGGGVIIGGVRLDDDWNDSFDESRVERIKQRACQLAPELGKPEDLQVVRNNVGLRRK
ncbi:D-amino acid oxidase, putative [Talaromyces stipitatus ATCC 10500]|uniref:D-amino acid oxidase, putative n=1 Tax=Talaromyces stipitatus (strain ATCC 10500 / CBS 375.48 / QM 6759 / NRRL 1006) TaxID=441959 RepID=B8MAD3_TALSN|nr:D-amino acid oxidase, putative [Talaromyces stipitatus ATCC 10500]EED18634.1 D-amino acid oxidase, putative [Talaromyces stipitatus ATCC 10500]